jgi:hypothetical protein
VQGLAGAARSSSSSSSLEQALGPGRQQLVIAAGPQVLQQAWLTCKVVCSLLVQQQQQVNQLDRWICWG